MNGLGRYVLRVVVLLVVLVSKFTIGAWIPAVVIPLMVLLLRGIKRHYQFVGQGLNVPPGIEAAVITAGASLAIALARSH